MLAPLTETAACFVRGPHLHMIDGNSVPSHDGAIQDVFDPSSGAVLTSVAMGSGDEVNRAVAAAEAAFPAWSRLAPVERAVILHRVADMFEKHAADLAQVESIDVGKAITAAEKLDIPFGIECLRYFAELVQNVALDIPHALPRLEARTHRVPYGACGFIFPWNFPFDLLLWNIVPALAAGNTVVIKPSALTPLSTLLVARLAQAAGVPDGVINVVVGDGETGHALARHAAIKRMSFTGSPRIGKLIGEICGGNLVPVKLELGGKGAAVVFEDADVDATATTLANAITFNTGQVCCTATRWVLHENIRDALLEKTIAILNNTRIGPALDRETQMGPLVSKIHFERVSNHLAHGKAEGAESILEPRAVKPSGFEQGYYIGPSLLTGDSDNICCREEIFGPSAFILTFRDENEAVRLVNRLSYGLANSVWSSDLSRANRVAEQLVAGNSWINAHNVFAYGLPYRAVNLSGLGGGVNSIDCLLDYLRPQTIARPLP